MSPGTPARPKQSDRCLAFAELGRTPRAGSEARHVLREDLRGSVSLDVLERALAVASALVNNSVVHGAGRIRLATSVHRAAVRVEVADEGHASVPAIRGEGGFGNERGWGLRLVDKLADDWGVREGHAQVWAEIGPAGS